MFLLTVCALPHTLPPLPTAGRRWGEGKVRGNFKCLWLGFCLWCWDRSLDSNRLNPLNLLIHESLHLGDMFFFQMCEPPLIIHILAYRLIFLWDVGILVLAVLPLINGPHPCLHRQTTHFQSQLFIELPPLWTGCKNMEKSWPIYIKGLAYLVHQVKKIGNTGCGDVFNSRLSSRH